MAWVVIWGPDGIEAPASGYLSEADAIQAGAAIVNVMASTFGMKPEPVNVGGSMYFARQWEIPAHPAYLDKRLTVAVRREKDE